MEGVNGEEEWGEEVEGKNGEEGWEREGGRGGCHTKSGPS